MRPEKHRYIQNEETNVFVGDDINVIGIDTLVAHIYGTSTSFTILFEGSLDGVNFFNISGTKLADPTVFASTTSTIGEAWEFDVPTLESFRTKLTAITNGNISVHAGVPN